MKKSKKILSVILVAFTLVLFTSNIFAQELSKETVSSLWPYPSTVIKVHSAAADIKKSGSVIRMADVITKSPTTNRCTAYSTSFKKVAGSWEFDTIHSQASVNCKTLVSEGGDSGVYSETADSGTSDPRVPVEDSLNEVNRTVGDVEEVHDTIQRVKNIKKLF